MNSTTIEVFNVVSTNRNEEDRKGLRTEVEHQTNGEFDIVRITQAGYYKEDEPDVVILTRNDFDRIASQLKGH